MVFKKIRLLIVSSIALMSGIIQLAVAQGNNPNNTVVGQPMQPADNPSPPSSVPKLPLLPNETQVTTGVEFLKYISVCNQLKDKIIVLQPATQPIVFKIQPSKSAFCKITTIDLDNPAGPQIKVCDYSQDELSYIYTDHAFAVVQRYEKAHDNLKDMLQLFKPIVQCNQAPSSPPSTAPVGTAAQPPTQQAYDYSKLLQ